MGGGGASGRGGKASRLVGRGGGQGRGLEGVERRRLEQFEVIKLVIVFHPR